MMFDTLNIPRLGKLEIVETYAYYDQPVLFSCKDAAGYLYLVVAVDKNDQYETWLYAGVSSGRLNRIRSGAIDLHDAFADTEDGCLFQVKFPYASSTAPQIESVKANQVSEDWLPLPGECLALKIKIPPPLGNAESMLKTAKT